MATRIAGSFHVRRRALKRRRRLVVSAIAAIVLIGAASVVWPIIAQHFHRKAPIVAHTPPSFSTQQGADVTLLAGAIGQYTAEFNELPTHLTVSPSNRLVICGSTCDAVNYEVGSFGVYKPSGIKFAPYAPGLTAPDQSTMYLVHGAKCGSNGQVGDVSMVPLSMIILYDVQSPSGSASPHCVVL
jgi:hypothetical protein